MPAATPSIFIPLAFIGPPEAPGHEGESTEFGASAVEWTQGASPHQLSTDLTLLKTHHKHGVNTAANPIL